MNPAATAQRRIGSPLFLWSCAVLLALLHALLAASAMVTKSATADEVAHLVAGYTYNARGDYRFQPENGNLPQRLAAAPMTWAAPPLPPPSLPSWQKGDVWNYAAIALYHSGWPTDLFLFLGRATISLLSAATALVVFGWSKTLFGWRGAFLSLFLYLFSPTTLAHGALVTSDMAMSFFFIASLAAWWHQLRSPSWLAAAVSAIVFGLACVTKFSVVLLFPTLALVALLWVALATPRQAWFTTLRWIAGTTLLHLAAAWLLIWAFYGFRYSAFSESGSFYRGDWNWLLHDLGGATALFERARALKVLPEAFLYGFAFVLQFSRERAAFLNGEYSTTGWVTFFPFTFVVKSTLTTLAVFVMTGGLASAAVWKRRRAGGAVSTLLSLLPFAPLVVFFAVYGCTSLASNLNIGHRHILPLYPVLFIAAGWLGSQLDIRRLAIFIGIGLLMALHASESFRIRPHYLAYFNPIAGGPANGWRHLVDSSLDWGQDLPGLKRWLDRHSRGEPVFLSYFGTGDPAYEGIKATALPSLPQVGPPRPWHALSAGVYAISATMLQHVYSPIRGEWTLEHEVEFQRLRQLEPALLAHEKEKHPSGGEDWRPVWKHYETLRFARLCHFLRARGPDAMIGYSILIFRLSAEEVRAAIGGSAQEWSAAIEAARERPAPR